MQPDSTHSRQEPKDDLNESRSLQEYLVLKHADTFLVANTHGDLLGHGDGLFHNDTRVLSRFRLYMAGQVPTVLSAQVSRDNVLFTAHLTNPPLAERPGLPAREGVIHVERARLIWSDALHERLSVVNHGSATVSLPLTFNFAADFHDLFEVRGRHRQRRGRHEHPQVEADRVVLGYLGRDEGGKTDASGVFPRRRRGSTPGGPSSPCGSNPARAGSCLSRSGRTRRPPPRAGVTATRWRRHVGGRARWRGGGPR